MAARAYRHCIARKTNAAEEVSIVDLPRKPSRSMAGLSRPKSAHTSIGADIPFGDGMVEVEAKTKQRFPEI